jgi:hypothetical protein
LYYNKKGRVENIKKTINQSNKKNESLDLSGFYLNRELEETNRLVDNVLQKLESFFT